MFIFSIICQWLCNKKSLCCLCLYASMSHHAFGKQITMTNDFTVSVKKHIFSIQWVVYIYHSHLTMYKTNKSDDWILNFFAYVMSLLDYSRTIIVIHSSVRPFFEYRIIYSRVKILQTTHEFFKIQIAKPSNEICCSHPDQIEKQREFIVQFSSQH